MRVKLIGVSDEARKSESVVGGKQEYGPLTTDTNICCDAAIQTAYLKRFDDLYVQKKLLDPISSGADGCCFYHPPFLWLLGITGAAPGL
jgi:hypothetical protein